MTHTLSAPPRPLARFSRRTPRPRLIAGPGLGAALLALCLMAGPGTRPALAERGADGALTLVYWQAPTALNPYQSAGTKDIEAASLVLEPLARHGPDGALFAVLAAEMPTLDNGGLSADGLSITWRLRPDITWSDGTPLTATDVAATAAWCLRAGAGCAQRHTLADVTAVEVIDPLQVRLTFAQTKPMPFGPFVGAGAPVLQARQLDRCTAQGDCAALTRAPIGTGPFVIEGFTDSGEVRYAANPAYRDPALPRFAQVTLRGGGDAVAAARAVLVTGTADYAWNLQLSPETLAELSRGGRGTLMTAFGNIVERIEVNLTDPAPGLPPEQRSTGAAAHPVLTDPDVRAALSLAIDRALLVELGYGPAGRPACNIIHAPAEMRSVTNDACLHPNPDAARAHLDAAGWLVGPDGFRTRDGVRLSLSYLTSTNAVRQDVQTLIGQWWRDIGIEVTLRDVPAATLFGGDPAAETTLERFPADLVMYANAATGPDPAIYLGRYRCGLEPRPDTGWQGSNIARVCDPDYDALHDSLTRSADPDERIALVRALNDRLVQSHVIIPLVARGHVSARADTLEGVVMNPWDSALWNIQHWRRRP